MFYIMYLRKTHQKQQHNFSNQGMKLPFYSVPRSTYRVYLKYQMIVQNHKLIHFSKHFKSTQNTKYRDSFHTIKITVFFFVFFLTCCDQVLNYFVFCQIYNVKYKFNYYLMIFFSVLFSKLFILQYNMLSSRGFILVERRDYGDLCEIIW